MIQEQNTLFLRLAGPMQSWGTSSRFQLRRTDSYPSKSGVLGMLLCAMGVSRADSAKELQRLSALTMGVRVDRCGTLDWDYHTAGAGTGIRSADGKIKRTASTGELETLLSRRQYLWDASFLIALQGPSSLIAECARALQVPVWPPFLGRKCCVPSEPVFESTGCSDSLLAALASVSWRPRIAAIDHRDGSPARTLPVFLEHPAGSPAPNGARLVHDVPRIFGYHSHAPRWIVEDDVTVPVGEPLLKRDKQPYTDPYGSKWSSLRSQRLEYDNYLCVFCKSPATDVHHLDYKDPRLDNLRSVCKLCHKACTMLEYSHGMQAKRIDPCDPQQRGGLLKQIAILLNQGESDNVSLSASD